MGHSRGKLWFGRATRAEELEQIFRLNHRTFTEEIPQHDCRPDGRLVDAFHAENLYVICRNAEAVVGMVALRGTRPFSLDAKVPDLDRYLPPHRSVCEIRLLAVTRRSRYRQVLPGLVCELVRACREHGYDYGVISATTGQLKLYMHLGFRAFGPRVGKPGAYFQPMSVAIEEFSARMPWLASSTCVSGPPSQRSAQEVSLLPGPATIHPAVLDALGGTPKYHRSTAVAATVATCRIGLTRLTSAGAAQIMLGSGTLANDAIAQQLRLCGGPGAVLSNGEFGERLVDHAHRAGLEFAVCRVGWGKPFDFGAIAKRIQACRQARWLWMAHCETSTGVLNDLRAFSTLARAIGAESAVDCVSTLGNVDTDLSAVSYASGVSGKGLAAPPGLAFVFHPRDRLHRGAGVPRYLDLNLYAERGCVPFTQSSNLLDALAMALSRFDARDIEERAATSAEVRAKLKAHGFRIVGSEAAPAPFVVTIALSASTPASAVGAMMAERGYRVAFESAYLSDRNWLQLAWMGGVGRSTVLGAVAALAEITAMFGRERDEAA